MMQLTTSTLIAWNYRRSKRHFTEAQAPNV